MHSKVILPVILTFSLGTSLCAQTSIGVEGGLSYNTYHTNIANREATALAGQAGFSVALTLRYRVYSWLYIVAAPGLVQKGYSMNRTDSLSGEYDQHINTYLQLPVGFGLSHDWRRFRIALDAGLYAGYWLYGRVKGNTADVFASVGSNNAQQFPLNAYDAAYSFDSRRDRRLEEGWWLGTALQYHLSNTWRLTAAIRYCRALTSAVNTPVNPIPAYNRTWIFSIGGARSLSHAKPRRL